MVEKKGLQTVSITFNKIYQFHQNYINNQKLSLNIYLRFSMIVPVNISKQKWQLINKYYQKETLKVKYYSM